MARSILSGKTLSFIKSLAFSASLGATVILFQNCSSGNQFKTTSSDLSSTAVEGITLSGIIQLNLKTTTITKLPPGLVLSNNGTILSIASGATTFVFPQAQTSGTSFSVTVSSQPSGLTCGVTNGSGKFSTKSVSNLVITCSDITYSLGGTISGLTAAGLVLKNSDGQTLSVNANSTNFLFATYLASGVAYGVSIQTQPTNQVCSLSSATGTVTSANVSNVVVTCAKSSFSLAGTISYSPSSGIVATGLSLANGSDVVDVSSLATSFALSQVASGGSYSVVVKTQPTGWTCSVSNGAGTALANVSNVSVSCVANSSTVGGTISLPAGISSIALSLNGGTAVNFSSGNYVFSQSVQYSKTYAVTVSSTPANHTCTVSNGSGTIATTNITNVNIVCALNAYTLSGNVSGLTSGQTVKLTNGTDSVTISGSSASSVSFTFANSIASGATYSVATSNASAGVTCTVSNGSGTMTTANVSNVSVICSTASYTVSGQIAQPQGLSASGLTLTMSSSNFIQLPAGAATFTLPQAIASGSSYSLSISSQPTGLSCLFTAGPTLTSGIYPLTTITATMGTANVSGIIVTCSSTSSGSNLNFTTATSLSGVTYVAGTDSVIIKVPAVANARDFRVIVNPTSVSAGLNGTEVITGGTQYCAGVRQHQSRTQFVADTKTLFPYYFYLNNALDTPYSWVPQFFNTPPSAYSTFLLDPPPLLEIEVTGVTQSTQIYVEAIDRLCPFPGIIGREHVDIKLSHSADTDHPGNPWVDASTVVSFPVVTEAEVIAKYGSLIINGQGWANGPNAQASPPTSPTFAQPAAANPPVVLARTSLTVTPATTNSAQTADFFDDFSNSADIFTSVAIPKWTYPRWQSSGQMVKQNSKWTAYFNGYTCCSANAAMDGHGYVDAFVANGKLKTLLADYGQDILSEITFMPRKLAHINSTNYLHVTFEVNSFATSRRYWAMTLCGPPTSGQTFDSNQVLKEQIIHSTFFYNNTGLNPSTAGWNCFQIFNRQGNSNVMAEIPAMYNVATGARPTVSSSLGTYDIGRYIYNTIYSITNPSQVAAYTTHPESDVVVLINKPIASANLPEVWGANQQVANSNLASPINVSPIQLDNAANEYAWFYKTDAKGNPISGILDDQQKAAPRTKYDLYIRNNRVIMYVNGEQRMCNDFTTPTTQLSMAESAVGFHQILYHSSGEFIERFQDPDHGAAYHYRYNSPFMDERNWDNIGFEENVAAPSNFNSVPCYVHKSLGAENNEP